MPPKHRGFALRTMSKKGEESTSGMVSWTLSNDRDSSEISRLQLAWKADKNDGAKFSLALGNLALQFDEMWSPRQDSKVVCSVAKVDSRLSVADFWTTVTAVLTKADPKTPQFELRLTIVPQKVDVWGVDQVFQGR